MSELNRKIKNLGFDFDVSELGAWTEENIDELLVRQVTESSTLQEIRIETGIKGKQKLPVMDTDVVYQDASNCGMEADGDTAFDKFEIEVHDIGFMQKFCSSDINRTFLQPALRPGFANEREDLPFEAQIVAHMLAKHNYQLERLTWVGDADLSTGNLQFFNGFKTLWDASADVVETNVQGYTDATVNNIFEIFSDFYANANQDIVDADDFIAFTSSAWLKLLVRKLTLMNLFHYSPEQTADLKRGIVVVPGTDMTVKATKAFTEGIYGGKRNEMIFGTDLTNDIETIDIWYEKKDDAIYLRNKFRAGVANPFDDQISKFTLADSPSS